MVERAHTEGRGVADAIRSLVLDGTFGPGDRLGEAELAARLDVSRTPVREALRVLAADGIVEHVPNKGARVVSLTDAELADLLELRAQVEGVAAASAARHATAEELDVLEGLADEIAARALPGPDQDLGAVYGLNARLHLGVAAAARSTAIASSVQQLFHTTATVRTYRGFDEAAVRRSVAHHHELVVALRHRDPAWARSVMDAHLRNARAALLGPVPTTDQHRRDASPHDLAGDRHPDHPPPVEHVEAGS